MESLYKKKFNSMTFAIMAFLLSMAMVFSTMGIYFKLNKKEKAPAVEINPLDFSVDVWDGSMSASAFNEAYAGRSKKTKTINSASAFAHFVNEVNSGNSFEGYIVYLNSSIDFAGQEIDSIGTVTNPFKGTFDGGHYTLFNAKFNGTALFENTENTNIKNVGLYNAEFLGDTTANAKFALVNKAVNTNIENTFVRLGYANLVNEFISNDGPHYIKNSFVDSDAKNLINKLDTNNSSENEVSITSCYFTLGEATVEEKVGECYLKEINVINPTVTTFAGWSYSKEYNTNTEWCDYDFRAGSDALEFNYPLQAGFVKVYLTGSCYESVVVAGDTIVDASNMAKAFEEANKTSEAEINLLVEKVFMEARAEATNNTEVKVNAIKDTTIVRGDNNEDSMFVSTGNSKITLGSEKDEISVMSTEPETTLTLDGNREYVEKNNLDSGALVVSYGGEVEINENVVIKDNINNTVGYGGAILLYNTAEKAKIDGLVENCHAENGGGALCAIGVMPETVPSAKGCSANGNGGAFYLSAEAIDEVSTRTIRALYKTSNTIEPMSNTTFIGQNVIISGQTIEDCVVESDTVAYGGAIYADGANLIFGTKTSETTVFRNCSIISKVNNISCGGGALFFRLQNSVLQTSPIQYVSFVNCSADVGGAIGISNNTSKDQTITFGEGIYFSGCYAGLGGAIVSSSTIDLLFEGQGVFENCSSSGIQGGAIRAAGDVTISSDVVFNGCSTDGVGGAIFSQGKVVVNEDNSKKDGLITMDENGYSGLTTEYDIDWNSDFMISTTFRVTDDVFKTLLSSEDGTFNISVKAGGVQYRTPLSSATKTETLPLNTDLNLTVKKASIIISGGGCSLTYSLMSSTRISENLIIGSAGAVINEVNIYEGRGNSVENLCAIYNPTLPQFIKNSSDSGMGGAIFTKDGLNVAGSDEWVLHFTSNSAFNGGAVYSQGTVSLSGIVGFSVNTSTSNGGAIYANKVELNDRIVFMHNTAKGNGGDVYSATTVDMTGISLGLSLTFVGVSNRAADKGGAIYAVGNVTSSFADFMSGGSYSAGGAIYSEADVILENTTISGRTTGQTLEGVDYGDGGAVYAKNILIKNGCEIKNNSSLVNGGALYATENVEIEGVSTFEGNSATKAGGVVYAKNITVTGDSIFKSNSAMTGGSLMSQFKTTQTVVKIEGNPTFESNTATGQGGAINVIGGSLLINAGVASFKGNSSNSDGGSIMCTGTVQISGTPLFDNNSTAANGGAICGDVRVTNAAKFTGNTATGNGGAIYAWSYANIAASANFCANKAPNGKGGAIYAAGDAEIKTGSSTFKNNSANEGGAIYCCGDVEISGDHLFEQNSATEGGGGAIGGLGCNVNITSGSTRFVGNSATSTLNAAGRGGAIQSCDVTILGSPIFEQNSARYDGAAIDALEDIVISGEPIFRANNISYTSDVITAGNLVSILGNAVFENHAGGGSGDLISVNSAGSVIIENGTFQNNKASNLITVDLYGGDSVVKLLGGTCLSNTVLCEISIVNRQENSEIEINAGCDFSNIYIFNNSSVTVPAHIRVIGNLALGQEFKLSAYNYEKYQQGVYPLIVFDSGVNVDLTKFEAIAGYEFAEVLQPSGETYVYLRAPQRTITYKVDGSVYDQKTFEIGETIVHVDDPSKTGYTFVGWFDEGLTTEFTTENMPDEDITLYAKFNINSYKLTYNLNYAGASNQEQTYNYAETITLIENPTRTGFTFDGWYNESACTTPFAQTTMPANDLTIYAKWTEISYKITYVLNYVGATNIERFYYYNASIQELEDPTRVGYTFDGWYNESTFTTEFTTTIMPARNLTVYAKWTKSLYEITFDLNYEGPSDIVQEYEYEEEILKPNVTRDGHTFDGWYNESNCITKFTLTKMPANDITVYAKWNVNEYKLIYNLNYAGAINSEQTYDFGADITLIADPTREGYTFDGWYNESACTTPFAQTTMPDRNLTVYAKWNVNKYKLIYNLNYAGATNQEQIYDFGADITLIESPTREGYAFIGWYNEAVCTTQFTQTTMPASNVTVYAKWEVKKFLLTYNLNYDGATNIVENKDYNDSIVLPDDPNREGYTFVGWYNENECITEFVLINMPDYDVNAYAKWEINSYALTYNLNYHSAENVTEILNYDFIINLMVPTREGYSFAGWYNEPSCINQFKDTTMPAEDVTIYASWQINYYTLTYNLNYPETGEVVETIEYRSNLNLMMPTREGYSFAGWYNEPSCINQFKDTTMPAEDVKIYASWLINSYTLTYNLNYPSAENVEEIIEYNSDLGLMVPTREGYLFNGWYEESSCENPFDKTTMPAEDIIIYASWLINSYTLTYNLNYESKVEEETYNFGATITLLNPTRSGFTFGGWYKDIDLIEACEITTMPAEDVTIYASWQINSYMLTYNLNYESKVEEETYNFGATITLLNPTRSGFTFGGWYKDIELIEACEITTMPAENVVVYAKWLLNAFTLTLDLNYVGSQSIEKDYESGDSVIVPDSIKREGYTLVGWYLEEECINEFDYIMPMNDLTVYAKWNVNKHKIVYNLNYAGAINSEQTYDFGADITLIANPIREGYTFDGWYNEAVCTTSFTATTMPDRDLTVYAKWTKLSYSITFDLNYSGPADIVQEYEYEEEILKPNVERDGHTFDGWYNESNCITKFTLTKMPANDMIVYAKWNVNEYKLIYNLNYAGSSNQEQTYLYGADIALIADPTREGYTFDGWYNEAVCTTSFTATTMPDRDLTVYAKWEINTYTVTISTVGFGSALTDFAQYYHGQDATLNITPNIGYSVTLIKINNEILNVNYEEVVQNGYVISNVTFDLDIYVEFDVNVFKIHVTQDGNGIIELEDRNLIINNQYVSVDYGQSMHFVFKVATGDSVASIVVDGYELIGNDFINAINDGYTFESVARDHSIHIVFVNNSYKIDVNVEGNGKFYSEQDLTSIAYGESREFKIETDLDNYSVEIYVNGILVNSNGKSFKIENIKEDMELNVKFVKKAFFETKMGLIVIISSSLLIIIGALMSIVVYRIRRNRRTRLI